MKRTIFALFALTIALQANAQSNVQFCNLSCGHEAHANRDATEYNLWAGSQLSYAVIGEPESFNTSFGLSGKVIWNVLDFGQPERLNLILYGNFAPVNTSFGVFNALNSQNSGVEFGFSPYWIFGSLDASSLTAVGEAAAKQTALGEGVSVWNYHFSAGVDGSLNQIAMGGKPLNLALKATYVVPAKKEELLAVQNEADGSYLLLNGHLIIPAGDGIGLLFQAQSTLKSAPVLGVGVIISKSVF